MISTAAKIFAGKGAFLFKFSILKMLFLIYVIVENFTLNDFNYTTDTNMPRPTTNTGRSSEKCHVIKETPWIIRLTPLIFCRNIII